MHEEVLSEKQIKLLPLLKMFSFDYGLVGGTAIALHIGHRRSIDFDLFTHGEFNNDEIRNNIRSNYQIQETFVDQPNELSVVVDGVKTTFLKYPFKISFTESVKDVVKTPNLITLAAMKSFSLGRRAKWKDYVDLYFVLKTVSFRKIVQKAEDLFKGEFNQKLFREQLAYFDDIDYSEKVDYMPGFKVEDRNVKEKLKEISLQKF